ncbi:BREX-1 system adenine-specific DNA-methyltransferase PglX [Plesiomonas sp. PI-19]|uniref:BREX-1 system adenine-specific DNA-methyltransferase PglX n=1 Tax=Plesiomonas sp. PI-19 TaxID=2898798 RepID=UPI001F18C46F|nr:BREX-1 system adenine-specific DNA-methyltransferase PglX [Plesiomonas sp. PI-19]MCE5164303.1 BREX-1 system adenine-specific DNA-methyltransferase PglX [Plesiomonas sp. PI-19]
MSQQQNNDMQQHFYRASTADFGKIPGRAIAYWASDKVLMTFADNQPISDKIETREGLTTGSNDLFLRLWHEVSFEKIGFGIKDSEHAKKSGNRYFPYVKGGDFRRWAGNYEYVVNWYDDGAELRIFKDPVSGRVRSHNYNGDYGFRAGFTWSGISSGTFAVRTVTTGFMFDAKGPMGFSNEIENQGLYEAFFNSKVTNHLLKMLAPTLDFKLGHILNLPAPNVSNNKLGLNRNKCVDLALQDWNALETSWSFSKADLLQFDNSPCIKDCIQELRSNMHETTLEMQRLEEENNKIFIDAYGLQDELTPEVPLSEITLTCNPHYRYGGNLTDEEREAHLQSDTICELISYAIGCMMGRYSLDREGLVYAHAGNEGFKALVEEGAYATFAADEDGILPLSAESWFADDVAARFEAFVRTVWGAEQFEENLQFIADSLCLSAIKPVKKGGETSRETLRRYLTTQFYKDHLKTYKKRPIYWLFSSGKEKAFECLVYLHRYNEATLPRMRTEYVTPLLGQIASRIERKRMEQAEASTSDAKRISKEIDSLTKQLAELRAFDDQLKHHADMRISLDLDDGVKVNYGKFGTLLSDVKAISGDKGE